MSATQPSLDNELSQAGIATPVAYDPFSDGELTRVVPTTEPQREVWLADRLGRDASLAFNESVSLQLRGPLDIPALHAALHALVERHDALRAGFGPDGETLCVRAQVDLPIPMYDLQPLSPLSREAAVAGHLQRVVETPFDLAHDLLLRAEVLRLGPDEHRLLLTAHHIVCDGWSWWVIVRELGALYARARGQDAVELPQSEAFADYALAQANGPGGAVHAADEAYWLGQFADDPPPLELPTDRPRPARRSFAASREDYTLDPALVAGVRRLGARRGASLYATLLAGFAGLMSRLAGQSHVVVGIPAAGQSVDGHDHLVGHCVNLLPLRFDLDAARPFVQVLDTAQERLLDAIEHQRYTFGTLMRKLRMPRDPARMPLVSVMFNIDQALDHENSGFPELALDFGCNARTHENFELFINAVQTHGALRLECQFNRDLFDVSTVRRWLAAYETLLRAAVEQPETSLAQLPMVDAAAQLELSALQPPPVAFDRQCRMHELFERQCDRTPERIAVRYGDTAWTYSELEARANRIAHLLRAQGVRRGGLVGLALDRSPDMLAALLAVLKSGAGYVPLDPSFPPERLSYMASDAGLAALVTQQRHAAHFDLRGRPVLVLDRLDAELVALAATRIGRDGLSAEPESPAYVIYTSGSTGRPKGVQVPHRAVTNFIVGMQRDPGVHADDRLLAVTTLSFDIAVLELLLPLSVGAQVVIADRDTATDGGRLLALLAQTGATMMQATPATWRLLLEAGWRGTGEFRVLCGGEPLPPDLATQLLPRCASLWNLYGPTETTVWSTCARVEAPSPGAAPDIHIGRPIANTQVWILDAQMQPCPRGVPGEICIGGDGVTLGYLGRPELTAERFVADRFASIAPGQDAPLLYRTGDRGRWRADGQLEHMGRLDFQVKVRGYRIELGEIENNLAVHPDVARTVVIAREDRPGDVRLVAYVVPQTGRAVDEGALQAHLRKTLPDYMIPAHVVALASVPLLPNGKIDRKGLPAPNQIVKAGRERVAPRNALEQQIATAMAAVLGVPDIGVEDDFFALGGHSLLAAQLTSRLSRELSLSLSLRTLFDAPTVARLAAHIGGEGGATVARHEPIPRRADQRSAPLSLVQERLHMLEEFNPGQLTYHTPTSYGLRGELDLPAFRRAFDALLQRQSVLRTSIGEVDGEPVQVVHEHLGDDVLPLDDLTAWPEPEREAEMMRRIHAMIAVPFDLSKPPLFVARLFKLEPQWHVMFFMPHHVVWDGWSFDLMYSDLAELYAAQLDQREPQLPELPVSYGDFAAWHREWVKGPEYARQLAFWRERLAPSPGRDAQALPTDKPRTAGMSGRARSHRINIELELTEQLRRIGLSTDATIFVILLAAYFALLHGVTGQRQLVLATPVRGRHWPEVEGLMGYFTSLLPLRMEIDPATSFAELVRQVKAMVLDSFAHPDIRLEDLTRELALPSNGGGRMLYQSLFSFQDIRQRVVQWGNVRHERRALFHPGATEDIGLWFVESESGLAGALVYNADVFHDETMDRLHRRYVDILRAVAADVSQPLAAIAGAADLIGRTPEPVASTAPAPASAPIAPPVTPAPTPAPQTATISPAPVNPAAAQDPRVVYLSALWSQLLDVAAGPDDNFFDLGGHSMLAVQMANRVARDTGVRIKLVRLATQTLAQVASEFPPMAPALLLDTPATASKRGLMHNVLRLFGRTATEEKP